MRPLEPWEKDLRKIPDGSLEAGLIGLSAVAKRGQVFSHRDIAKACGCSRGWIFLLEQNAVKKIRERMRKNLHMSHGDFFGSNSKIP